MCVVGLNVSVANCGHRWYELVRSCGPNASLAHCAERLQIEGWEIRNERCPWCNEDESSLNHSTHRLIGSTQSTRTVVVPTPALPDTDVTRTDRKGSGGTLSNFPRRGSSSSNEMDSAMRHREMNNRLHIYLNQSPHKILPSAYKYYPTTDIRDLTTSSTEDISPSDSSMTYSASLARRNSVNVIKRSWRRSVRFSRGIFSP